MRTIDAVAALEGALDRDDAGRQQALAAAQRARRAVIDDQRAGRVDRAGDPRLARRARLAAGQEQGGAAAGLDRGERRRPRLAASPSAISMGSRRCIAMRAAASLVTMPPEL